MIKLNPGSKILALRIFYKEAHTGTQFPFLFVIHDYVWMNEIGTCGEAT